MPGDYRVVLEGAVHVAEVDSTDEAVSVAVATSGELLNPDLDYVTIRAADRSCPDCGGEHDPASVAAGDALVALEYELTVFNADGEEHAARIARAELGQYLEDVPLSVESIELVEADDGSAEATDDEPAESVGDNEHAAGDAGGGDGDRDDTAEIPEFEDVVTA